MIKPYIHVYANNKEANPHAHPRICCSQPVYPLTHLVPIIAISRTYIEVC